MTASLFHRWDRFFHREVSPHSLAILRIGFGLFLMLYWGTQWVQAPLFSAEYGALFPRFATEDPFARMFLYPSLPVVHLFFASTFLFLTLFTIGYRTRISALCLILLSLYFNVISQWMFTASFYRLFQFMLAVFLLPGGDRTFSLSMRLEKGSFLAWEPISILPLRLLALQMTATYIGVGWQKLLIPEWRTGAILWNGFTGRWGTPLGFWLARTLPSSVFDILIHATVVLECLLPIGLWSRRYQGWFFVGGFLFHTLITLTLGIWWFQILVPLYIVFLDPDEVYKFLRAHSSVAITGHADRG